MKRGRPSLRQRLDLVPLSPGWPLPARARSLGRASASLGFAPFYLFPLPIAHARLAGVALAARTQRRRTRLALGFGFGLGYFLTGAQLGLREPARLRRHAAPLAALATARLLRLPRAVPGCCRLAAARVAAHAVGRDADALLFPAAVDAGRMDARLDLHRLSVARGRLLPVADGPLSGFAPLLGVYGVSLLAAAERRLAVSCWCAGIYARRAAMARAHRGRSASVMLARALG